MSRTLPVSRSRCSRRILPCAMLLLGLAAPGRASGQSIPPASDPGVVQANLPAGVMPGTRVRVRHVNGQRLVGTATAAAGDTILLLGTRGVPVAIAAADIAVLEQSLGVHRNFWRNFGWTVMGAAATGGVIGAASWTPCTGECWFVPKSRADAFLLGGIVGGVLGAPVGVLVGAVARSEHWMPVHRGSPYRFSLRPTAGARGVGVAGTIVLARSAHR